MAFMDLPEDIREKALGDVFCIKCQKSFRLENYTERQFKNALILEGNCPHCGGAVAKPVSAGEH